MVSTMNAKGRVSLWNDLRTGFDASLKRTWTPSFLPIFFLVRIAILHKVEVSDPPLRDRSSPPADMPRKPLYLGRIRGQGEGRTYRLCRGRGRKRDSSPLFWRPRRLLGEQTGEKSFSFAHTYSTVCSRLPVCRPNSDSPTGGAQGPRRLFFFNPQMATPAHFLFDEIFRNSSPFLRSPSRSGSQS